MSAATDKLPLPARDQMQLALRAHTALYEMLNGTARREEWSDLADAINCVESLCEMQRYPQIELHYVQHAIEGMQAAIKFSDGRMRFDAMHSVSLRRCVQRWDEATQKFSRATIAEAQLRVIKRIQLQRLDPDSDVVVISA